MPLGTAQSKRRRRSFGPISRRPNLWAPSRRTRLRGEGGVSVELCTETGHTRRTVESCLRLHGIMLVKGYVEPAFMHWQHTEPTTSSNLVTSSDNNFMSAHKQSSIYIIMRVILYTMGSIKASTSRCRDSIPQRARVLLGQGGVEWYLGIILNIRAVLKVA